MTSLETLRKIFKSSFNYRTYSNEIVHHLFGCNDVATTPEPLDTNAEGDKSHYIGQMEDTDGRLLGFFYTRVADGGDVRRKRVGLRKLIQPYLKYDVDGAIAVFDDGNHWRLSYICDLKEGNTAAKRFSYILGDEQGQYKTPLERLGKVAEKNGRFKLSDLREVFSVDALSKEFFDEYHRHYDIIINELKRQGFVGATIHDYVKKMMGRIVFLHFLQKKRWLDDDPEFLNHLFFMQPPDRRADFLEQVLEPLFFGIFNTESQRREKLFAIEHWDGSLLEQWKKLPYLNGGLFERDEVDKMKIKLPASLFKDLFTFMASYNFTVDENDPDDAEVGVDPEMLGKIFESLLEDNKAKGAFYTPKEIVRYMCKESLIAYLSSRVSETPSPSGRDLVNLVDSADTPNCERSDADNNLQDQQDFASETSRSIRRFVETYEMQPELEPYREALDTALREVKICDPAIGSGAFPMGLLNELWRCREALYYPSPAGRDLVNLIDSADASNCERSNAKDNLQDQHDFVSAASRKIEYSRSQLKKEIIENNIYGVDIEKGAIDIARLRFWLSIVVDAEEPEPLPNFDYKFMQGNSLIESFEGFDLSRISSRLRGGQSKSMQLVLGLDSHTSRQNLQRLLREYFSVTDHKQKSSMRQAINEEVKTLIRESIGGTPASLAKLEKMDCSANQDFFLWHTWFKDIFDNGGFDIIVANPPYISAIEAKRTIDENVRQQYKDSYITAAGTYDLYVIFIELGFNLLKRGGTLSYITPSKYLSAEYAKTLREYIYGNYSVEQISDYSNIRVFENAGVSTMISRFKKNKQSQFVRFETYKSKTEIETSHVYNKDVLNMLPNNIWGALLSSHIDLFLKIHSQSVTVEEYSDVNACSTAAEAELFEDGLNSVYIPNAFKYINNGTINRYVQYWGVKEIRSKKILHPYLPFSVLNARRKAMFMKEKLIFVKLAKCPQVFLDEHGEFASANTNMVYNLKKYDYKFLLAYFNSKLFDHVYRTMFGGNSMLGSIQVQAPQIRKSLIPKLPTESIQQPIIDNVNLILKKKEADRHYDTSDLEHEIDKQFYALYNLTPEEIAIIEQ